MTGFLHTTPGLCREGREGQVGGVVYFLRAGASDNVKIGWTSNLQDRVRKLQCANPNPLRVIGQMPGDRGLEGRLHHQFAKERGSGEWFKLSDRLRAFINTIGEAPRKRRPRTPEPTFEEIREALIRSETAYPHQGATA